MGGPTFACRVSQALLKRVVVGRPANHDRAQPLGHRQSLPGKRGVAPGSARSDSALRRAPGRIRTCDLVIRSDLLYPAELRGRQRQGSQRPAAPTAPVRCEIVDSIDVEDDMSMEPLAVLIGSWEIVGRSPGADHDNIRGTSRVVPILSGHVLQVDGTMRVDDIEIESVELVWPDPAGGFSAHVYSSDGVPLDYHWTRDGMTLTHAGSGATYVGAISDDGTTIEGRWRPDAGQPAVPGSAYDAVMRRVS